MTSKHHKIHPQLPGTQLQDVHDGHGGQPSIESTFRPEGGDEENGTASKLNVSAACSLSQVKPLEIGPSKTKHSEEYLDQIRRESETLWLTDLFVDKPCTVLSWGFLALVLLSIIPIALEYWDVATGGQREYFIRDDPIVIDYDKYTLAKDYVKDRTGIAEAPLRTEESQGQIFLLFENKGDYEHGLLQKDTLLKIEQIEKLLVEHQNYSQVCLATSNVDTSCSPRGYQSPLGVFKAAGVSDLSALTQEEILDVYRTSMSNPSQWYSFAPFYDKFFGPQNLTVTYIRTIVTLGMPVEINGFKYDNKSHLESEQTEFLKEFALDVRSNVQAFDTGSDFTVNLASFLITIDEFLEVVLGDALKALFSLAFVFFYMMFHLKSKFLAFIGVSIIVISFPITLLLTEGVFRVTYLGSLQIVSIFLVLGIGCDDIFVFVDAWRQSEALPSEIIKGDRKKRMAYAFRRACRAMAVTSSTTSVAFFANVFSPIMPIRSFGIIAGVIIPINFFLVVMLMPPAVIYLEDKLQDTICCCIKSSQKESTVEKVSEDQEKKLGFIETFFDTVWNPMVFKGRWIIIVISVVWTIFASTQALQMGPQTKQEEMIDPEHPAIRTLMLIMNEFSQNTEAKPSVYFFWGVDSIDKSEEPMWDSEYLGDPIFSETFNPALPESQTFLDQFCTDLVKEPWMSKEPIKCWIHDFKAHLTAKGTDFPIQDEAEFMLELQTWLTTTPEGFTATRSNLIGIVDGKIIYTAVETSVDFVDFDPRETKLPYYEDYEAFTEKKNAEAPASMAGFSQNSETWTFMPSEVAFAQNAKQGIGISIVFAFIILMIATGNYIISLISIICVGAVIISIIAIMHLNGQELGTTESISIVVLVGFSVDYTVHLATDYTHSAKDSRFEKMRQALREMGISIFSGFVTTFGCGFFLFFGNLSFFSKFGLLITSTVLFSFLSASLLFAALCHIFGPEKDQGYLMRMLSKK